ncbi:MAG: o-succinylbenzoate synthase [Thermoplasmata archaeon]|nr:o-succinylbenzoate synthase [Thermoplasmata archaeon]
MRVVSAELIELDLPLVAPFATSFGVERRRRVLLAALTTADGLTGWSECVAAREPRYSSETVETVRGTIVEHLLPALARSREPTPAKFDRAVGWIRGHRMARATIEMALWDLTAQRRRISLARVLGGRRDRVEVGVSVGLHPTTTALLRSIEQYQQAGYGRVKLKVRPGRDEGPVRAVRRSFPDLRIWVDANQAYPASAVKRISHWLRRYAVEIVEQPFAAGALTAHARLARTGAARVALDESVEDRTGFEEARHLGALGALNVKPGRVGGLGPARTIAGAARRSRIPAWVGGMLETGIGRAHNVALASTAPFTLPADLSASDRYFADDIVEPPFALGPGSTLRVPSGVGLGVAIEWRELRRHVRRRRTYTIAP